MWNGSRKCAIVWANDRMIHTYMLLFWMIRINFHCGIVTAAALRNAATSIWVQYVYTIHAMQLELVWRQPRGSGLHWWLTCVAAERTEPTITKKLFRRRNQRVDLMQSQAFAQGNVSRVWPYIVRSHRRWTRCGWKCSATHERHTHRHSCFSISLKNCECTTYHVCAYYVPDTHKSTPHNGCILCINVRYFWETANNSTLFKWETFFVLLFFCFSPSPSSSSE